LATFQALREHDGDPVLILDDVFAELDAHRRERLAHVISDVEQTIITVADLDDVPQGLQGTHGTHKMVMGNQNTTQIEIIPQYRSVRRPVDTTNICVFVSPPPPPLLLLMTIGWGGGG
jgi:hypothetical protein